MTFKNKLFITKRYRSLNINNSVMANTVCVNFKYFRFALVCLSMGRKVGRNDLAILIFNLDQE